MSDGGLRAGAPAPSGAEEAALAGRFSIGGPSSGCCKQRVFPGEGEQNLSFPLAPHSGILN